MRIQMVHHEFITYPIVDFVPIYLPFLHRHKLNKPWIDTHTLSIPSKITFVLTNLIITYYLHHHRQLISPRIIYIINRLYLRSQTNLIITYAFIGYHHEYKQDYVCNQIFTNYRPFVLCLIFITTYCVEKCLEVSPLPSRFSKYPFHCQPRSLAHVAGIINN